MKTIVKLVIAALVVHACWRATAAYWRFYQLQDGMQAVAVGSNNKSDAEVQSRVVALAQEQGIALEPERVIVTRDAYRTKIDASYQDRIEFIPTRFYPWEFKAHVDALTGSLVR